MIPQIIVLIFMTVGIFISIREPDIRKASIGIVGWLIWIALLGFGGFFDVFLRG